VQLHLPTLSVSVLGMISRAWGSDMKKLLLAATILAGSAGLASAADLPQRQVAPAPYVAAPAFTWTGFYVGANAGLSVSTSKASMEAGPSPGYVPGSTYFQPASVADFNSIGRSSKTASSFTGGAQAGYNWQHSWLVYGLEADFEYLGVAQSEARSRTYSCCGNDLSIRQKVRSDWLATARVRLGASFDRLLVYATGGLAFQQLKYTGVFSDMFGVAASGSMSDTRVGFALGAGAEYAVSEHVSAKLEYLYVGTGTKSISENNLSGGGIQFPDAHITHKAKLDVSLIRVGINYRF
jgi:outer membrane immunogenic protein